MMGATPMHNFNSTLFLSDNSLFICPNVYVSFVINYEYKFKTGMRMARNSKIEKSVR